MPIGPEQLAASNTEHGHQAALFCWAASSNIPELKWLFAIPNGFFGSAAQKGKMKAEGLKNGVADLMLPIPRYVKCDDGIGRTYHGLFVEMKIGSNRLSKDQKEFGDFVTGHGYRFVVCYSWIEAKNAILQYLGKV